MKKHSTLVVPVIFCFVCTTSCKKDKPHVNPDEVRLTGWNTKVNGGHSDLHFLLTFNTSGNITLITSSVDYASPTTSYSVIYHANEIIMARPAVNTVDHDFTDSLHLFLDGNGKVTKRIHHEFEQYKPPVNSAEGAYMFDTTVYEYDGSGLLSKETRSGRDTAWFNSGIMQTTTTSSIGESIYTNSNGDLKSVSSVNNTRTVYRTASNTSVVIGTSTGKLSFDYFTSFPNTTDFTNAAVLNELNLFGGLPMNKNYKHLPSNSSFFYTERDEQGGTIYTNSSFTNNQFTYNYYGFLESKFDPAFPDTKMTYVYNR